MRIKESLLVLLALAAVAVSLAFYRFGGIGTDGHGKPLVLQLSWRAQVESGGFVQAAIDGFYKDCGLDVELRQGGAGMDPSQLLVGRAVDAALIPQADGVLHMNRAGFPARAIFASMQHSPSSLIVHDDSPIRSVAEMRGHPIMISASSRTSWWPFLRAKYGLTDEQLRSFTGQRAPFVADPSAVAQDMISNGPYLLRKQSGLEVRSFLLTDMGYDPYAGILTVSQQLINQRPAAVRCLVEGSRRGWEAYMRDPRRAFDEISRMSPEVSRGLNDYGFKVLVDHHIVATPDTDRFGFGAMNDERWRSHVALLIDTGLLPRGFDYRQAYYVPPAVKTAAASNGIASP